MMSRLDRKINLCARSGKAFFCYRLPDAEEVCFVPSAKAAEGIRPGGFLISSFDKSLILTLLPSEAKEASIVADEDICADATTREEHRSGVERIVDRLNSIGEGKCVLSRLICGKLTREIGTSFCNLLTTRPDAFVFIFSAPGAGIWLGASPEILLRSSAGQFTTMSLAGTRKASDGPERPWDSKNLEEQQIVTDFITATLRSQGIDCELSPLTTRRAGVVEHLMRTVDGYCRFTPERLHTLLDRLSPTPALGGFPREEALRLIEECESHDRGCYGGFCGPVRTAEDFDLFVNLRSARVLPASGRYRQYVGGGITRFSRPDDEWAETEMKAATLIL